MGVRERTNSLNFRGRETQRKVWGSFRPEVAEQSQGQRTVREAELSRGQVRL